jgi:imidazolonepropionase
MRIVPTLLAHVVPPDRAVDRDRDVAELCEELIPTAAAEDLAVACDVFCERGAFTLDETRRIFEAARRHRLALRVHAEQLTHTGGTRLAAELGAASADHLEHAATDDIAAMAAAGTVAVLLPGAETTLATTAPPTAALRAAGVPMALATDCNPGSSHTLDLRLMMWLGCLRYRLTPEETLSAVTANAGRALGLPRSATPAGRIVVGQPANLLLWNVTDPAALIYRHGEPLLDRILLTPPNANAA